MLKKEDINALNWAKAGDLMPAIVQDARSGPVSNSHQPLTTKLKVEIS